MPIDRHAVRRFQIQIVVALLFAIVMSAYDLHAMRGTTFYNDEWAGLTSYSWSPSFLLRSQGGHNFYFSSMLWNGTMAVFGTKSYVPFLSLGLMCNLFAAAGVFVYGWKRLSYGAGLLLEVVALTLGSSFQTVLWPDAALGLMSIGVLLFALLILDRPSRWGAGAVVVGLVAMIGVGGYGLLALFGVTVEILLRRRWRLLWIPAIPSVLYLAWRVHYHVTVTTGGAAGVGPVPLANFTGAPSYIAQQLTATVAGLTGQVVTMGAALTVGLVVLVGYLSRGGSVDKVRIAVLALVPVFFWLLLAIVRGQDNEFGAPRYVAFGALPITLILVEAVRSNRRSRGFQYAAIAAVCFCGFANFNQLENAAANFRALGAIDLAIQSALQMSANYVPPTLVPFPNGATGLVAGPYLNVVRSFGSNAPSPAQLSSESEAARSAADVTLIEAGAIHFVAARSPSNLCSEPRNRAIVPVAAGLSLTLRVIAGPTTVSARRFADPAASEPVETLLTGTVVDVAAEPDAKNFSSPVPWQLTIIGGRFKACG